MYFQFGPILKMKEITILNSSLWDEKLRHFTNLQFNFFLFRPHESQEQIMEWNINLLRYSQVSIKQAGYIKRAGWNIFEK